MRRPPAVDVALAAGLVVFGVIGALSGDATLPRSLVVVLTVAYTAPLAFRRRYPLPAVTASLVAIIVMGSVEADNSQPTVPFAIAVGFFTLGCGVRWPLSGLAGGLSGAAVIGSIIVSGSPAADAIFVFLFAGGAWLSGRIMRSRADVERAASERAAQAEAEHAIREASAVDAERQRLARELHDVVSHSISVVAIQAQAIRGRLRADQHREIEDLKMVETTARAAMVEMRRLLGILRSDGERAPLAPQPGLGELEPLLERTRAAGLDVGLDVQGTAVLLPPGVDLAAYRIVQESLTNVVKHAGAATAHVCLSYEPDEIRISVEDDGRAAGSGVAGGHGLIGMRERVALYGGQLTYGTRPDGGFGVRAELPIGQRGPL